MDTRHGSVLISIVRLEWLDEKGREMANGPEGEQVIRAELRGLLPPELGCDLVSSVTWDQREATTSERKSARQTEFRLGRECAVRALQQVGWNRSSLARPAVDSPVEAIDVVNSVNAMEVVGVGAHREPLWPAGFIGSLSHSRHWTWAVAGCRASYRGVGIDTEAIMDARLAAELREEIGQEVEWTRLEPTSLPAPLLTTVLWSAKEAYFKLWFPLQGRFLTGHDVRLCEVVAADAGRSTGGQAAMAGSMGLVLGQVDESPERLDSRESRWRKTYPLAIATRTKVVVGWTSRDVFAVAVETVGRAPVFTMGETE